MPLPRLHLFEVEDQPWLPSWLRGYLTDWLRVLFGTFVHRTPVAERLLEVIRATGEERLLDLCSGSSGPLLPLVEHLERRHGIEVQAVLSDKYPNLEAFAELGERSHGRLDHVAEPVDARAVPVDAAGIRTLFAGLHHFRPDDARSILADAVRQGRGLAAFEVSERRFTTLLTLCFLPLVVLLATPFVLPPNGRRWLFTYLLPVVPVLVFWDGWVSCWRTYTPSELESLAAEALGQARERAHEDNAATRGYRFRVGQDRVRGLPVRVTYLLGIPGTRLQSPSPGARLPESNTGARP